MLDYHLHLWPHGEGPTEPLVEQVAAYCEAAARVGVVEVALTEHLFRFVQADALLRGWWEGDPDTAMAAGVETYWDRHQGADLDRYVEVGLAARREGLPVRLGLEVDYYPGRMDKVAGLLAGYPFDVLLGSVHWLGTWMFDDLSDARAMAEWDIRGAEWAWAAYTEALCELASTGTCDVLAHPDLAKVTGRRPARPLELYDRMAEAAASSSMAAEVSSAGWRKPAAEAYPAPDLLARFCALGVPITTASDAHRLGDVGDRMRDLRPLVDAAGYRELATFDSRRRGSLELAAPGPPPALAPPERAPAGGTATGQLA
ncbi:MAG: PHP domain-containing protein [Acidimicrobiales bacterium]